MHENSIYCTYNHSKPVLNALYSANLIIGKTIKRNRVIGTIASFNPDLIKNKYDKIELGELNTKSAITYKDKNLKLTNEEILRNREFEIKNSTLITLSQYKKQNSNQSLR